MTGMLPEYYLNVNTYKKRQNLKNLNRITIYQSSNYVNKKILNHELPLTGIYMFL